MDSLIKDLNRLILAFVIHDDDKYYQQCTNIRTVLSMTCSFVYVENQRLLRKHMKIIRTDTPHVEADEIIKNIEDGKYGEKVQTRKKLKL